MVIRKRGLSNYVSWFDFVVLMNIATNVTIIPCVIGLNSVPMIHVFLLVLNFLTIFISGNGSYREKNVLNVKYTWPLIFMMLLYIWEILKTPFINGPNRFGYSVVLFLVQASFLYLLFNKYQRTGRLESITRVYIYISIYVVLSTVLCWLLLNTGVISVDNSVSYYIMNSDITQMGSEYYFPKHLSVILSSGTRLPLLHTYGIPCGLSHEPHVSTFFVTPGLILAIGKLSDWKKYLLIGVSVLFFLISISMTNFVGLAIVLAYYVMKTNKKQLLVLIPMLAIIFVLASNTPIFGEVSDFIQQKSFSENSGSGDYSYNHILYALQPNTIIGTTFYSTSIAANEDVGAINSLINICFFVSFVACIFKCLLKAKGSQLLYVCAILYFLIHSAKTNTLNYTLPFTIYMVVITSIITNKLMKNETI